MRLIPNTLEYMESWKYFLEIKKKHLLNISKIKCRELDFGRYQGRYQGSTSSYIIKEFYVEINTPYDAYNFFKKYKISENWTWSSSTTDCTPCLNITEK